jgi:hypothetical protein
VSVQAQGSMVDQSRQWWWGGCSDELEDLHHSQPPVGSADLEAQQESEHSVDDYVEVAQQDPGTPQDSASEDDVMHWVDAPPVPDTEMIDDLQPSRYH